MHNYVIYVRRRGTCTSFHVQIDYVVVTVRSESSTINTRYLLSLPSVLCRTSLLVFCRCILASGVDGGAHSVQGGTEEVKREETERLHSMAVWGSFL